MYGRTSVLPFRNDDNDNDINNRATARRTQLAGLHMRRERVRDQKSF